MPFPKPLRYDATKRRRDLQHGRGRAWCREIVWEREHGRCQNPDCHMTCVDPKLARSLAQVDLGHVHEIVPRSLGGDALDPDNCVLVCAGCHERLHRRRRPWLRIVCVEPVRGARGVLGWENYTETKSGKTLAEVFADEAAREGE